MHTVFFAMIFIFFFGGYAFFLTSTWWMPPNDQGRVKTELNQELNWLDKRKVTLIRWDYSENQRLMEIEMEINNLSFDGVNTYKYAAVERNKGNLQVKTILEEPDWIILQLTDVPKKFSDIAVQITNPDNGDFFSVYTNMQEVDRVEQISEKDRNGYLQLKYEHQIQAYEEKNKSLQKSAIEEEKAIKEITEEKNNLEKKAEYQTERQKQETANAILDAESKIQESKNKITEYKEEAQENQNRIEILRKQKEEGK